MDENSKLVVGAKRKPPNAGKGRVKGVPNKTTAAIKDMITQALSGVGGVDYLMAQAQDNPNAFLTLVGKVIPLQVNAEIEGNLKTTITKITLDGVRPE